MAKMLSVLAAQFPICLCFHLDQKLFCRKVCSESFAPGLPFRAVMARDMGCFGLLKLGLPHTLFALGWAFEVINSTFGTVSWSVLRELYSICLPGVPQYAYGSGMLDAFAVTLTRIRMCCFWGCNGDGLMHYIAGSHEMHDDPSCQEMARRMH